MEFQIINYIKEYPYVLILCIDFMMIICLYTSTSYKELKEIAEKSKALELQAKALEVQAQEIQDQLIYLKDSMSDFRRLTENLYNLHSARQFKNTMRNLYVNKARNMEVIRSYQASEQAYKNAKNEFTEFVLTLC